MTSRTSSGVLLLAGALSSACIVNVDSQGQVVRDEKRFGVEGVPQVRLTTFDGPIEIQSWDRPEVLVEIEKRGPTREAVERLTVEAVQEENRVDVAVKRPSPDSFQAFGFTTATSARFIVSLPRRSDVNARTGDGSIRLERVHGSLELRTGDGAIRVDDAEGDLTFNTGDGAIVVDGAEGRLTLETGDGGVNVTGRLSAVRMHTGDGSIVYRVEPGSVMADDWEITTGDGAVALHLPPGFSAQLDAHTGDGSIRSDVDLARASQNGRNTLKGRLGEGGRRLRIHTGDGAISLKQR